MDTNTIRVIAGIAAVIILFIIVWRRTHKAAK
jgi:hypothetical protein